VIADRNIVEERISLVQRYLRDLREFSDIAREDFRNNPERQYAVLHALQLAIEASIDIATHICSSDSLGTPTSYVEAFDLLENAGIVGSPLADKLRSMARFRNRIVHLYQQVDTDTVYDILQNHLEDFKTYLAAIECYLSA
jgi:uncharacterized protein YutE (UPF0331/DUF86 family)